MKIYRFTVLILVLLLTLPLLAPRCSKTSNDPAPQNSRPSTIVSIWGWQKLLVDPPVDNITDILDFYIQLNLLTSQCLPLFEYEFKSDGSIVSYQQKICSSGLSPVAFGPKTGDKWSVSGSNMIITHANGTKDECDMELKDGTLSDGSKSKVMIWKRKISDKTYTWVFARKL